MGRTSNKGKSGNKPGAKPAVKSGARPGLDLSFIIQALLIGILGSIILLVSYVALEFSWLGLIAYSDGLRSVYFAQSAALILLVPVFMGALAVLALSPRIKRYTYAMAAGMVSGITAGIGFAAILSLFAATIDKSQTFVWDWPSIHDAFFRDLAGTLAAETFQLPGLPLFILLSIALAGVGGSAFYALSFHARARKSRAPGMVGKAHVRVLAYAAVVLVLLAIVPPILAFSGIKAGLVGGQAFHSPVSVQRLGNDTLVFTNNGGDRLDALDPGSHFILYAGSTLFSYDLSSQSTAALPNVTLDPAGGLGVSPGSKLTVKGPGIASVSSDRNASTGTNMTHVYVLGNATDGRQLVYLDTFV